MSATPPKHLCKIGRAKWREILPIFETRGDVDQGTLDALEQYVVAWSRWQQADDDDGKLRWSRCCRQWAAELRLSPRSRTAKPKDDRDPLLKLLRRPAQ